MLVSFNVLASHGEGGVTAGQSRTRPGLGLIYPVIQLCYPNVRSTARHGCMALISNTPHALEQLSSPRGVIHRLWSESCNSRATSQFQRGIDGGEAVQLFHAFWSHSQAPSSQACLPQRVRNGPAVQPIPGFFDSVFRSAILVSISTLHGLVS